MQVVKALIGGLIGGGIGAYLGKLGSASEELSSSVGWLFLLAGVLAGLGVRLVCGADRSFLTGVIAAVTAVLAIMGASYATSVSERNKVAETMNSAKMPVIDIGEPEALAEDPAAEAVESAEDTTETAEQEPESVEGAEATEAAAEPTQSSQDRPGDPVPRGSEYVQDAATAKVPTGGWSMMEFVVNGISALIAFAIGSGSAAKQD